MIQTSEHHQQCITDAQGNRIAVILDVERYEALLQAAEELNEIRAFDEAKASGDEAIRFEQGGPGDRAGTLVRYTVKILRRAQRGLAAIPVQDFERIRDAIFALADDPRPLGCAKLTGRDAWRIRVGQYRRSTKSTMRTGS